MEFLIFLLNFVSGSIYTPFSKRTKMFHKQTCFHSPFEVKSTFVPAKEVVEEPEDDYDSEGEPVVVKKAPRKKSKYLPGEKLLKSINARQLGSKSSKTGAGCKKNSSQVKVNSRDIDRITAQMELIMMDLM